MKEELFYSIWRNQYIASVVRNNRFQKKTIRITTSYLSENHQFLSLLDTRNYDIYIKLHCADQVDSYLNHPFKYIINALNIYVKSAEALGQLSQLADHDNLKQLYISFGNGIYELGFCLPASLVRLHFHSRRIPRIMPRYTKRLPDTLKELILSDVVVDYANQNVPDSLTSLVIRHNFGMRPPKVYPSSLKTLEFGWYSLDEFSGTVIPAGVEDLKIVGRLEELAKFKVYHDKVYRNATFKVYNQHQLAHLNRFPWVSKINLLTNVEDFENTLSTIERVDMSVYGFSSFTFPGYLPSQLEKNQSSRFQFFSNSPKIQLVDNIFPSCLQVLELPNLNTRVPFDLLPKSLTELDLSSYTIIGVDRDNMVPQGIRKLTLGDISSLPPNSLPNSITDLCITQITGPIDQDVFPSNLEKLRFKITIDPHQQPQPKIILPSSITDLSISYNCKYRGFHSIKSLLTIPKSVVYLHLTNIVIERDLIPMGCYHLSTNYFQGLQDDVLPTSVRRLSLYLERCHNQIINIPPSIDLLITPHQVFVNRDTSINEKGVLNYQKKNTVADLYNKSTSSGNGGSSGIHYY
ncbi:hypothetical protein CYY_004622 [Polysphondylium violaceum]|uniref:FNIP repeat-containing protein n=1 Tax=Polysphondylium violaceum TaxID=133409 RepID=A0A8J4V082_9MYCE|nr:hypothetical protein CYY_004622 [Polysphondylium violaceum]